MKRLAIMLVLGCLLVLPASASAAPATTGGVTAITATSATLNGSVDTTSSDSEWFFQYGTSSTTLNHSTTVHHVGAVSSQAVTQPISGLTAQTTYFYRLVVIQNVSNSVPSPSDGDTLSFTTSASGGGGGNTIATTGDANTITSTSAALHGVADTSSADSGWAFQYGPSPSYGKVTPVHVLGAGVHAVSYMLTGLKPNTTYHYRLVVNAGTYPRQNYLGKDRTFKTLSTSKPKRFGKASLTSRKLTVHRKRVRVTFRCKGATGTVCKGRVKISARGKIGKRVRTVSCGASRFTIKAGHKKTLRPKVSKGCAALLAKAKHHRIHARLQATFSSHQRKLKVRVTLKRV